MSDKKSSSSVVILGAGATGLFTAAKLSSMGFDVTVIEKENLLGGLAKTTQKGDYLLDFGPHFLTSEKPEILSKIISLFSEGELTNFNRRAKIYFHDRYLDYPLTAKNVLFQMGFKNAFFSTLSYLNNYLKRIFKAPVTEYIDFETWARDNFGDYLYKIFFKPYTEQFWGITCDKLSLDCIPLVTKMSFLKTLKMLFMKNFAKASLSIAERETTLTLYYPKNGIGEVTKKLIHQISVSGQKILSEAQLSSISQVSNNKCSVKFIKADEKCEIIADHVISTIPISNFIQALNPTPPELVLKNAEMLDYLSLIVVYLVLPDRQVFDCSYLYLLNKPYNRISSINEFCEGLSPNSENMLGLEITCHYKDARWNMSDEELFNLCIDNLEKDEIVTKDEVKKYFVIRARHAYPLYRVDYAKSLEVVTDHVASIPNLHMLGRTGTFKYMDIDQCLEDSINFVEKISGDS